MPDPLRPHANPPYRAPDLVRIFEEAADVLRDWDRSGLDAGDGAVRYHLDVDGNLVVDIRPLTTTESW